MLRIDVVLSDITGKSGLSIIKAILKGERQGKTLAQVLCCLRSNREESVSFDYRNKKDRLYKIELFWVGDI